MMADEYKPVPVQIAKSIADQFDKSTVVILCYDAVFELTHCTTYGKEAFDKENAAAAGEICTRAVGADLSRKQSFEDFHNDYSPALHKEAWEILTLIRNRGGTNPAMLQRIERWCGASGDRLRQG